VAARDVDINVRVRALQIVTAIDKTGLLEDEEIAERAKVPKLLFDSDVRVRRAVGGFIEGMWAERVEALQTEWKGAVGNKKKRAKGIDDEKMEGYLARKALAELLVETTALLDGLNENGHDDEASGSNAPAKSGLGTLSRALATVEALQPHIDVLGDWEALGEYLLLDHSSNGEDAWLLDEAEESLMLQVFIACVKAQVCWPLRIAGDRAN
jgi:cohesin complex subunit SA-1/2